VSKPRYGRSGKGDVWLHIRKGEYCQDVRLELRMLLDPVM